MELLLPMLPPTIAVGTVLGETYEVTGMIGAGGMGAIYIARHTRLPGKQVAIKVLLPEAASHADAYARFKREAEVTSRLGHPNIVQVIDFNTLPDGTPYLVLEYLEGETLRDRVARLAGPMPVAQVVDIARQVASALDAAHHAGVIHRDLKPENVFLCRHIESGRPVDRIKVLDFGISKIQNASLQITQESAMLGTPQYMAPEQAQGKNTEIDERTDVFALGAMVYEMISGAPAFGGSSLAEVVFQVVYQTPPALATMVPNVPGRMVKAVERALAKARKERFATASDFARALSGEGGGTDALQPTQLATTKDMQVDGEPQVLVLGTGHQANHQAKKGGRKWVVPVAAAVGLLGAGFFVERLTQRGGQETGASAGHAVAFVPDAIQHREADASAPAQVPDAAQSPAPPDAAAPMHDRDPQVGNGSERAGVETIPGPAKVWLDKARTLLKQDDLIGAKRAAEKSLGQYRSGAVYGLLTEIYCRKGEASAFAYYQNIKGASERLRTYRACKATGFVLPAPHQ